MSDSYKIKYSSKDQFYVMVAQRFGQWVSQLEEIEGKLNVLGGMESFQGTTAESVKAYLNEVHNVLLISVRQTILDFQYRAGFFFEGYYDFEPNIYANISSETLRELRSKAVTENTNLQTQYTAIQNAINGISDLAQLNNPSQENVCGSLTDTIGQIDALDRSVSEYERAKQQEANGPLAELIASLHGAINAYYLLKGNITGYTSGDYAAKTEILDLYNKVTSSMQYTQENQEAAIETNEEIQKVFTQQQKDYEEACEARKDEGTANMILGALAVAGGVAAIILTAGAATPIVVVAGVSGTCAAAYGVSNFAEGAQDLYYGSVGDLSSEAWNPIRDTVFCGNQALYDAWGGLSLTVAGLCVPVNSAVNSVAGASGKVIAKEVAKTVVKESVKGAVIGEASEQVTNVVAKELDLNKTQTVILNQVVEAGLEKGVDAAEDAYTKHKNGALDGDFTDRMSYEDAKRYNEFMNDPDAYRANLDQVNVELPDGLNDIPPQDANLPGDVSNGQSVDYTNTANTPEEIAILQDMEDNGEFVVGKEDYGAVEVNPDSVDPKAPNRRLPTEQNGTIIGDRESGTFEYIPDDEKAQAIMEKYGEKTVKYQDNDPDFSPYTKHDTQWGKVDCEVEVGHMVGSRDGTADNPGNYQQADIALSEKISAETGEKVTPEQIKAYRESSNLTWHETSDGKTMQLVPTEINSKCAHNGGVSVKKYEQAWGDLSLNY